MPVSEQFVAHGSKVICLALGQESGNILATAARDGITIWDAKTHDCIGVCYFQWIFIVLSI
jgi:WD40 repeat protein